MWLSTLAKDRKGISLSGLARAAGLDYSSIWSLNAGKTHNPKYETFQSLAGALDMETDTLVRAFAASRGAATAADAA
jgi:transcriptional regulator with XRE-family HTH domain